ncbi:hypothetical protein BDQ12DRAFT_527485 [Crucibulum laeve]|uniref:Uncharacterized protein n=1 Tax=Crucibulum laeve TaxID=68775 RepID=A0A5C3LH45_9AGAR|nr:hypothetical protein BDQ12DRAFT_527485 [Crucibulum laeve]
MDLGPLVGVERGFRTRERMQFSGGIGGVEMYSQSIGRSADIRDCRSCSPLNSIITRLSSLSSLSVRSTRFELHLPDLSDDVRVEHLPEQVEVVMEVEQ